MKPIISVEGLGKKYTIRHEGQTPYRSLREEIVSLPVRLLKRRQQSREEFWALKNVSFDVMPGERLGIIGRNGAGKSTLLKLLSRITEPSTGRITLRGRVASLLEVGTGFHPELTGRENIFLNGAILGMTRAEVRRKFDEIVEFADVERFLDTPVKRYSSGMYVRLAFAVAAHLEPEVLIVDEVLAVGDAEFQKKCLGKMKEVGGEGRTVIFVSHNMVAIEQLCEKAGYFCAGSLQYLGDIDNAIHSYLSVAEGYSIGKGIFDISSRPDAIIHHVKIFNSQNIMTDTIFAGEKFSIEMVIGDTSSYKTIDAGITFYSQSGVRISTFTTWSERLLTITPSLKKQTITLRINTNIFSPGIFYISPSLSHHKAGVVYDHAFMACSFNILESPFQKSLPCEYGPVILDGYWE